MCLWHIELECDPQCRMNILPSLMVSIIEEKKHNVPMSQGDWHPNDHI